MMNTARAEAIVSRIRQHGLKVTPQRVEVFRVLVASGNHPSAEQLHRDVQDRLPSISLDTVYRTLSTLSDHGLIDRVNVDDSCARYQLHTHPHHHFVCTQCNQIHDVEWPEFDRLRLPDSITRLGKSIVSRVELRGICEACLASGSH